MSKKLSDMAKEFKETLIIEEIKPLVQLHPPKRIEKTETIEKLTIDQLMEKLAKSSDFKRLIYLAVEGKSWRGTNMDLDKTLDAKLKIVQDPNLAGLIAEMKEHFQNGFTKPSQIK